MNCDGYNCKSLMGNWYEERLALKQNSRLLPIKKTRDLSSNIYYYSKNGMKELNKVSRLSPWNTKNVKLDDGYVLLLALL